MIGPAHSLRFFTVAVALIVTGSMARAQLGGSPSPGSPGTTAPSARPSAPSTAPGAPLMSPLPPQPNPTIPPGMPGSNVAPRQPQEFTAPTRVQPSTSGPAQLNVPPPTGGVSAPLPSAATKKGEQQDRGQRLPERPRPSPMDSLAECMRLWDKELRMSRREWAAGCRDTLAPRGAGLTGYTASSHGRRAPR